jgi:uncharacterized protein YyaL (SSP411 family)
MENKPIFLSIGYAACHWCHVMAHESFEDEEIAELMNNNFINIKVDREERPDLDNIYMDAVVAITGQGGWPMSVFLTPDMKPFYGGTYFPPVRRYNMPSFREVLILIANLWTNDREKVVESSERITDHLFQSSVLSEQKERIHENILDQTASGLAESYDWENGGWGKAPKFPQPMAIEFLLRRASRGDLLSLDIALHALDAMSKGGLYDVVGGGFSRYSTDDNWLVPHFEKMLYDNAQLSLTYLHAYLLTKENRYRNFCENTLDFIMKEMTHADGGFYSSLDADSEGEEGKFYIWSREEIAEALDNPENIELTLAVYDVTEAGNFEGYTILNQILDNAQIAEFFNIPIELIPSRINEINKQLLNYRDKRIRPDTDDKILVSWNALMLSAFAEAGRYLNRDDYSHMAIRNAEFISKSMLADGRLQRSWRRGISKYNAYLEDHAALILALLNLYQTDPDPKWYTKAVKLTTEMVDHFRHPDVGFYDTRDDHESLLMRPKDVQDNAIPSGNALAATALLKMAAYTGNGDWRDISEDMLASIQTTAIRYPVMFSQWLSAMDFALGPTYEIAVIGNSIEDKTKAIQETIWSEYRPRMVFALSSFPVSDKNPPLLYNRPMKNDMPTAYVCQNFECNQPVNTTDELQKLLKKD